MSVLLLLPLNPPAMTGISLHCCPTWSLPHSGHSGLVPCGLPPKVWDVDGGCGQQSTANHVHLNISRHCPNLLTPSLASHWPLAAGVQHRLFSALPYGVLLTMSRACPSLHAHPDSRSY